MKIAVASGKGGTGKTTVAVSLYHYMSTLLTSRVKLIDCDVEEPNDALFFSDSTVVSQQNAYRLIPRIDTEKCTFCRRCSDWCVFNALVIIPGARLAEVDPGLCHSCGACLAACSYDAITEEQDLLGTITSFKLKTGAGLTEGKLKIGSAMQTALIRQLKTEASDAEEWLLLDAPPGTSCPVVETISDADYVILVTEPTPFGLYDLTIMVKLIRNINKPFGVIINKSGTGEEDLKNFLHENSISILGQIPFSREFASQYAQGDILRNIVEETDHAFRSILDNLKPILGL
jgi:MinD superfamily P-loop ATPase